MWQISNMWQIFILFTVLTQIETIWAQYCQCGRPSEDIVSMRIVGGRRAEPHSFPWTVAILKDNRVHCGSALITDRHLISAGHCFRWDDFRAMIALLGLDSLDDLRIVEERAIANAVIHQDFKSTAVRDENDIAIATLSSPVRFSSFIIPVCLPMPGENFGGRVGTIVGWGRLGADKSSSRYLMKATLNILTDTECVNSKLSAHLKPMMMCAFSQGKDGCQGDSGGPLVVFENTGRYVLAGVVSWGIGCADPRYPGVYTKVADYIPWITMNTADGVTCQ